MIFTLCWTIALSAPRLQSSYLMLPCYLTFRTQIDNVVSKCHGLLGTLARATPYLPKQLLKLTYTTLICSHLEYCAVHSIHRLLRHISKAWHYPEKSGTYRIPSTPLTLMQNHFWFCLILMLSATEERNTSWNWLNPSSLESVTRQWSRSWVRNWINHLWYKALELALAEEDLVWLVLPCTATDLVSVLTQRTHNPLYVTGTRSWKWTGHIVFQLPGSCSLICNSHLRSIERCYSTMSSSYCTKRR